MRVSEKSTVACRRPHRGTTAVLRLMFLGQKDMLVFLASACRMRTLFLRFLVVALLESPPPAREIFLLLDGFVGRLRRGFGPSCAGGSSGGTACGCHAGRWCGRGRDAWLQHARRLCVVVGARRRGEVGG